MPFNIEFERYGISYKEMGGNYLWVLYLLYLEGDELKESSLTAAVSRRDDENGAKEEILELLSKGLPSTWRIHILSMARVRDIVDSVNFSQIIDDDQ